jgi:enoyl-CoA hydratase
VCWTQDTRLPWDNPFRTPLAELIVGRHGPVTVLTLNRPEAHNCVNASTAVALAEAIEAFAADSEARVLVLTGAGERAFCSGADLKDVGGLLAHPYRERSGAMGFSGLDPGKPVIAAVNGYCFAGGMELACWCDFRIASENATFGALNRRWGVPFTDGGTQRIPRLVGLGNALWLIETGVRIDARRALGIGLVQEVVAEGEALPRALDLAQHVAGYPQASLGADRACALSAPGLPLADGLALEAAVLAELPGEAEMWERLKRFAEGERPEPPSPPG